MVVGNFIYLNVRGISNFRKRRTVFTWCRKQKADVIFLQATHSTKDNELLWKREWGAPFFCSHGANNSHGAAILIRNNFYCSVEEIVTDADGRYIMLKVLLRGERAFLDNIQLFRQRLSHKSVKAYATMPIGIMGRKSLAWID